MADLKEMILSKLPHGKETLQEIKDCRKNGHDYRLEKGRAEKIIKKYHPHDMELKVSEIIELNKDAKTFRFVAVDGALPVFQAGQYINVFVEIDGVRTSRPYSLSSSPRQRAYYEITVARIATGFVSDFFLDKVKVGDVFTANGPAGVFYYNPVFHSKKQVFIAGGSGITPFVSMSREIFGAELDREIHLIYGCRNEEAVFFKAELEDMAARHANFKFSLVLSEPCEGYKGLTGFITAECIKDIVGDIADKTYYICGPQIMNDFVVEALGKLDVDHRMIRREMFGARQDINNEPGWPAELTGKETFKVIINDGEKEINAFSGESLLTALERSGVRINVCCRSGECSLCRIQLVDGKVFMPRGVLLRHADEKFGYIHSCKAYPITDVSIYI
ncbi:MAG: FAD-binding oxidoreductase [Oscillospiraceae bacterium]